jgi:hypothetical protein
MALRILYEAWKERNAASAAMCAADIFNADLMRFSKPLDEASHSGGGHWYQLMDEGILFYDDTPSQQAIRFLHPSDVGSCLMFFGAQLDLALDPADDAPLSDAEQLSLLRPIFSGSTASTSGSSYSRWHGNRGKPLALRYAAATNYLA